MFYVQNYDKAKRTVTEINTALQGKVNKSKILKYLAYQKSVHLRKKKRKEEKGERVLERGIKR